MALQEHMPETEPIEEALERVEEEETEMEDYMDEQGVHIRQ